MKDIEKKKYNKIIYYRNKGKSEMKQKKKKKNY